MSIVGRVGYIKFTKAREIFLDTKTYAYLSSLNKDDRSEISIDHAKGILSNIR